MIFLQLFWEFLKTGLFAVGGGLATLPFLKAITHKYPWFTANDLMDMIAVSESTPGPMGVNSATYAGFHAAGLPGALTATFSLVLPSVIIIILVSRALDRFRSSSLVQNGFYGLRPASAGLIFGVQALVLVAVTTLACVAFEYIYEKLLKKSNTVGDLSAVVTGIILALNMPVGMPLWIAVVGAFVAIVITKQLFGGLGYNFANPALVGRIVLFLGFTSRMTAYVYPDMAVDALASATPLAVADKTTLPLLDVFLGFRGGMMGEVCVLAILLGFAYLVATRTIQATIPVTIVATVFVLTALNTGSAYTALIECMSGGLLFGAVFMATDYVTSPFTTKGKLFYGVFIGLITFLIRHFGSMNEGMSYAILLGNLMTPWFNAWGHQTPLGYKKPKKAKKGGAE